MTLQFGAWQVCQAEPSFSRVSLLRARGGLSEVVLFLLDVETGRGWQPEPLPADVNDLAALRGGGHLQHRLQLANARDARLDPGAEQKVSRDGAVVIVLDHPAVVVRVGVDRRCGITHRDLELVPHCHRSH
jgi:hypothetical protein